MQTREQDEAVLHMLDMHEEGLSSAQIARVVGVSSRTVRRQIRAVKDADIEHDPEARKHWANREGNSR